MRNLFLFRYAVHCTEMQIYFRVNCRCLVGKYLHMIYVNDVIDEVTKVISEVVNVINEVMKDINGVMKVINETNRVINETNKVINEVPMVIQALTVSMASQ